MTTMDIVLDHEITSVVKVVEQRTIAFLRDELDMKVERTDRRVLHEESVLLRALTAIVGVGSRAGLYIAFSYDEPLIRAMTKRFAAGIAITPDEEPLYMRETASEIVNVIVGNCTADLAKRGGVVTLSPPVLALGAKTIQGRPKTAIAALTLTFAEGALEVAFVGPKIFFDENLNYRGGA